MGKDLMCRFVGSEPGSITYLVSYTKNDIDIIPCCHKHALNLGTSYTVLEHLSDPRVSE